MECPFELPVTPFEQNKDFVIIRNNKGGVVCRGLTRDEADYIIQAINSHDSMKEFIEETDNTESYREWCNCNKEAEKE